MESIVVKHSNIFDGREAALNLIKEINKKIKLKKHSIGILFYSASLDAKDLIETFNKKSDIKIIGCSSSGEICNDGYLDDSVVLMVLTHDEKRFYSGIIENIKDKNKEQLNELLVKEYNNCKEIFNDDPSIMMTFPNFNSIETIEEIFEIVNSNYPKLPMFGGASAIDFNDKSQKFTEFYDGKVYEGSMPFLFIKTDVEPLTAYENIDECTKNENMNDNGVIGTITDCEVGIIKEIDNLPAYEFVKKSIDIDLDASEVFILYPLLVREKNISYTRVILNIDRETGYLYIAGSLSKGSQVSVQILSHDFVEKSSKLIMNNIRNKYADKKYKNAICVSCACRKLINIFDKKREAEIIIKSLDEDINIIGFYSYGEISPIEDNEGNVYNFYNNETISICLF